MKGVYRHIVHDSDGDKEIVSFTISWLVLSYLLGGFIAILVRFL